MSTASRTTGYAPLAVFFDAMDETGWDSDVAQPSGTSIDDRDFPSWHYRWDFGDAGSGTWEHSSTGQSKNEASGHLAAHVFETPGTYTVTLTVTEADGTTQHTYRQIVTVHDWDDADGVDGQASTGDEPKTYYVSSSDGDDGDDGSTPADAFATIAHAVDIARTYRGSNASAPIRILLKRGDSWTVNARLLIDLDGPGLIGDNKPFIDYTGDVPNPHLFQLDGTNSHDDWRLVDLDLDGNESIKTDNNKTSTAIKADDSSGQAQFLALRLDITDFFNAFGFGTAGADKLVEDVHIADCHAHDMGNKIVGMTGTRCSILGSKLINNLAGQGDLNVGEHIVRLFWARKFVVSENILHHPSVRFQDGSYSSGNTCIKLHNRLGDAAADATEFIIISGNHVEGGDTAVTMGPQNGTAEELVRKVVFERNLMTMFEFEYETGQFAPIGLNGIGVYGPDIVLRNNRFNLTDAGSGITQFKCINVNKRHSTAPIPHRALIYHNTAYRPDGKITLASVSSTDGVTGVEVRNNLVVPNSINGITVVDGPTTVTKSDNVVTIDDSVLSDPSNSDFTLDPDGDATELGLIIDEGSIISGLLEDYLRASRPMDGDGDNSAELDIGAHELVPE